MNSNKYHVALAVLSEVTETETLYFPCPNCAQGIQLSKSIQERLQYGGVGHQCPHCGRYIAIVVGTCCNRMFAVDDLAWDRLARGRPIDCPSCNNSLYLRHRAGVPLGSSFRETPTLSCFSEHASEVAFISAAKLMLPDASREALAIYHRTTKERLSLAFEYLNILQDNELTSSFAVFNTPNLHEVQVRETLPSSSALPNLVFLISSSLFSAIESLAQEANIVIRPSRNERDVSYQIFGQIDTSKTELSKHCAAFIRQPNFIYLKKLRNLSLHRRVSTLATVAEFTLPAYMPIRPSSISPVCIHYLPDDPLAATGKETFDNKCEVKNTLNMLGTDVRRFTHDLYDTLAKQLSHGT